MNSYNLTRNPNPKKKIIETKPIDQTKETNHEPPNVWHWMKKLTFPDDLIPFHMLK